MSEKVIPCEVYSRIVGYHRPVQSWNKGKCEEFKQRKEYSIKVSLESDKAAVCVAPKLSNF